MLFWARLVKENQGTWIRLRKSAGDAWVRGSLFLQGAIDSSQFSSYHGISRRVDSVGSPGMGFLSVWPVRLGQLELAGDAGVVEMGLKRGRETNRPTTRPQNLPRPPPAHYSFYSYYIPTPTPFRRTLDGGGRAIETVGPLPQRWIDCPRGSPMLGGPLLVQHHISLQAEVILHF